MRRALFLFIACAAALSALEETSLAVIEDEVARVDHLIDATRIKLSQQQELKEMILLFRDQEEEFFRGNQSKSHAKKMVDSARRILEIIKSAHLEHLFSSEYLEELALFSSIAGKNSPTRP